MIELRELTDSDVSLVEMWLHNSHVKKWYDIPHMSVTLDDWMHEIKGRNDEFSWLNYLVITNDRTPIGVCQYYKCMDSREEEFGDLPLEGTYGIDYFIGEKEYLGKGFGKQAVQLLIKKIFSIGDAVSITADIDKDNVISEKTLLSCGFIVQDEKSSRYVKYKVQSFLMIGQSNMAGRGFLHEVEPIINERIVMLRNGRWQMMVEPINFDRPVAGVTLASSFAQAWCQENELGQIGLIPCAEGGSAIDEWSVDKELYQHAINEVKLAMRNSQLVGILWHQGESDSLGGKHLTYYDKLCKLMQSIREDLNVPTIPMIIGGLTDFLGKTGFGKSSIEYTYINEHLRRFTLEHENSYFVDASGLASNPDGIHINAVSQRKFGLRYFNAFSNCQHVLKPLNNEDEEIKKLTSTKHTVAENMFLLSMKMALGEISYEDFEKQYIQLLKE